MVSVPAVHCCSMIQHTLSSCTDLKQAHSQRDEACPEKSFPSKDLFAVGSMPGNGKCTGISEVDGNNAAGRFQA